MLAQYGGGTGEPNDPYQIWTPEQMNAIGADPNNWDKHFKLMADIDLSGYDGKAGHPAFNTIGSTPYAITRRAGIGSASCSTSFRGVFDGNGHIIANLTLNSAGGLFLYVSDPNAQIKNLTLLHPTVNGGTGTTGPLVASLEYGTVSDCNVVNGVITGGNYVGGLVGSGGNVTECHATGIVMGTDYVGGLVGSGNPIRSFATADVIGRDYVGGLVGNGSATNCYATGAVFGNNYVGGLIGRQYATNCYSTGLVTRIPSSTVSSLYVGGLVGYGYFSVTASFWDIETSGQGASSGGEGKTTAQMQTIGTFLDWGKGDSAGVWIIEEGHDYPHLAWEHRPGIPIGPLQFSDVAVGTGTADDPYLISTPVQLYLLTNAPTEWTKKYFKLMADLNMADFVSKGLSSIGTSSQPFTGVFDGNGHTISGYAHTSAAGDYYGGLFGWVEGPDRNDWHYIGVIKNLGLISPLVTGQAKYGSGALAGTLAVGGVITGCYVDGGLVMDGNETRGGMVGENTGIIKDCFASIEVFGGSCTGGLVGRDFGTITNCYSTGLVRGGSYMGGLIGANRAGSVIASFWDIETSGQAGSAGGTGLTTAQMQMGRTFSDAGWDFVGETANGTADVWWIDEGHDYPHLDWDHRPGIASGSLQFSDLAVGTGIADDPYLISRPIHLYLLTQAPAEWSKDFKLTADLDMADYTYMGLSSIGTSSQPFTGIFDGNHHTISRYVGRSGAGDYSGLFGFVGDPNRFPSGSVPTHVVTIKNLGLIYPLVNGQRARYADALVAYLISGAITGCYVQDGLVSDGAEAHGGMVGYSLGAIDDCFASISVVGGDYAGGLVGRISDGIVTHCYSTGLIQGGSVMGGLVGHADQGSVTASFWDIATSGQAGSAGGTGLTTAQMQTGSTFLDTGWDFVGETANGTDDVWWIDEGKAYPRLIWGTARR